MDDRQSFHYHDSIRRGLYAMFIKQLLAFNSFHEDFIYLFNKT